MYTDFENLPSGSRIWIYQSNTHLEFEEVEIISARLLNFLDSWQAHGKDLKASFRILYERFVIVALDEASYQATGCSIDKLTHQIQSLEKDLGLSLLNRMQIAYRDEGLILTMPLNAFRGALEAEEYDEDTVVFNNLVETKEQLENEWEVPVKNSWHKQLLPVA